MLYLYLNSLTVRTACHGRCSHLFILSIDTINRVQIKKILFGNCSFIRIVAYTTGSTQPGVPTFLPSIPRDGGYGLVMASVHTT